VVDDSGDRGCWGGDGWRSRRCGPAQAVVVYVCTSGATSNLCQINSDGSHESQLTSNGSYSSASLDPAGTRMVFNRGGALYAADGSAQNPVGPISDSSSLAKISFDGTTGVDDDDRGDGSKSARSRPPAA